MELGSATTLEKSRKTKQALSAYRRIVQEYPDSPQAKIAAERVTALGSK
jgi:TolA-binding protein